MQEREEEIEEIQHGETVTWTSISGQRQRQIDYVLINQRFRNNVRMAKTISGWGANTQQEKHHISIHVLKNHETIRRNNAHRNMYQMRIWEGVKTKSTQSKSTRDVKKQIQDRMGCFSCWLTTVKTGSGGSQFWNFWFADGFWGGLKLWKAGDTPAEAREMGQFGGPCETAGRQKHLPPPWYPEFYGFFAYLTPRHNNYRFRGQF